MLLAHFIFLTVVGPAAQHLSHLKVPLFFFSVKYSCAHMIFVINILIFLLKLNRLLFLKNGLCFTVNLDLKVYT